MRRGEEDGTRREWGKKGRNRVRRGEGEVRRLQESDLEKEGGEG